MCVCLCVVCVCVCVSVCCVLFIRALRKWLSIESCIMHLGKTEKINFSIKITSIKGLRHDLSHLRKQGCQTVEHPTIAAAVMQKRSKLEKSNAHCDKTFSLPFLLDTKQDRLNTSHSLAFFIGVLGDLLFNFLNVHS